MVRYDRTIRTGRYSAQLLQFARLASENPSDLDEVIAGPENTLIALLQTPARGKLEAQLLAHSPAAYKQAKVAEDELRNRMETMWQNMQQIHREFVDTVSDCTDLQKLANMVGVPDTEVPPYDEASPHLVPDFLYLIPLPVQQPNP